MEGDSEMGFEPLIGKLMGSGDGDPRARDAANRIASFRRSFFILWSSLPINGGEVS
jgi:hypothetical protein